MPKFASGNRLTGTASENKAVVSESLGSEGTYTVDEVTSTLLVTVEASTFANQNGTTVKRHVDKITSDELVYLNPATTVGAATVLTFKRLR